MTISQSQLQKMHPDNLYAYREHYLKQIRQRKAEIERMSHYIDQINFTLTKKNTALSATQVGT